MMPTRNAAAMDVGVHVKLTQRASGDERQQNVCPPLDWLEIPAWHAATRNMGRIAPSGATRQSAGV